MTAVLMVTMGAVVGALARHLTEAMMQRNGWTTFPWGTFTVNVVGSFVLGVVAALAARGEVSTNVLLLVGTGGCGALTTFSGFAYRVVEEGVAGKRTLATTYVVSSVVVGVAAAALGYALAS